jgi:hypothetical protein
MLTGAVLIAAVLVDRFRGRGEGPRPGRLTKPFRAVAVPAHHPSTEHQTNTTT